MQIAFKSITPKVVRILLLDSQIDIKKYNKMLIPDVHSEIHTQINTCVFKVALVSPDERTYATIVVMKIHTVTNLT